LTGRTAHTVNETEKFLVWHEMWHIKMLENRYQSMIGTSF